MSGHVLKDLQTVEYFDKYTPEYGVERLISAAEMIKRHAGPDSSLVDIGCGVGNVLQYFRESIGLKNLCGIDVSPNYLEKVSTQVGCEAHLGSILDQAFVSTLTERFDFAVMGALLHHLIGRTRSESARYAQQAVVNALQMIRNGGHLIICEPVFYPAFTFTMGAVFYLKKIVTSVVSSRIHFFNEWNNIGAPVVSYLTKDQLVDMVHHSGLGKVIGTDVVEQELHWFLKLALIRKRQDVTLMIQKG
jgi:SAM-dependent methyltransferase